MTSLSVTPPGSMPRRIMPRASPTLDKMSNGRKNEDEIRATECRSFLIASQDRDGSTINNRALNMCGEL
jgi:hypothetical protein